MFYRYLPSENDVPARNPTTISSFSYTELQDEPSLVHSHSNCEVMIPLSEGGYLLYNGKKLQLKEGQIVIINPSVMHTERKYPGSKDRSLRYYSIRLDVSVSGGEAILVLQSSQYKEIRFYLENALTNLKEKENNELGMLNLMSFCSAFRQILKEKKLLLEEAPSKFIPSYIKEAKAFINTHYSENISLEDLASSLNISENILYTHFEKFEGTSPRRYLTTIRMKTAENLLKTTDYSISQIANLCGYKSSAYFTKHFKEQFGVIPKAKRN